MTVSPITVRFDDRMMWVDLSDGRILGVPLAWFPRLRSASPDERRPRVCGASLRAAPRTGVEISAFGPGTAVQHCMLHRIRDDGRGALDEDISLAGLLAGRGDRTASGRTGA